LILKQLFNVNFNVNFIYIFKTIQFASVGKQINFDSVFLVYGVTKHDN